MTGFNYARYSENPDAPEYEPRTVCPYCGYEDPEDVYIRDGVILGCEHCVDMRDGEAFDQEDLEKNVVSGEMLCLLWDLISKSDMNVFWKLAIQKFASQGVLFLEQKDFEFFREHTMKGLVRK